MSTRTEGDLRVLGLDPDTHGPEIRSQLGVVPQEDSLDTAVRVRDDLIVYGRYPRVYRRYDHWWARLAGPEAQVRVLPG